MGAAEAIRNEFFGIVTHAKGPGFVKAGAGRIDFASA